MPQAPREVIVRAGGEVRGTQSFVQVMASVFRRPSLTGLEVLWRWVFGAGALWLLATSGWRVWLAATGGTADAARVNLDHFSLMDPAAAAARIASAAAKLLPPALHAALWLAPLLLVAWVLASAVGRTVLLRRMDSALKPRTLTLIVLGFVRVSCLAAVIAFWLWLLAWCGRVAVTVPAAGGEEPNLVLYFAMVITVTLVLFVAWAVSSWVLSIAPLLSALRGLGAAESLRAATRLGPLRSKLIEINLVMGIVKIALLVLAMVFSATPLPFQSFATEGFLLNWWAGVALLYLLASDYFHVVRLAACVALCREYDMG